MNGLDYSKIEIDSMSNNFRLCYKQTPEKEPLGCSWDTVFVDIYGCSDGFQNTIRFASDYLFHLELHYVVKYL